MVRYNQKTAAVDRSLILPTLLELGESHSTACVLATLLDGEGHFVPEIHKHTGYSTAKVFQELKALEDRGWVQSEDVPNEKRGRNPKAYEITVSKSRMKSHYQDLWKDRIGAVERALDRAQAK